MNNSIRGLAFITILIGMTFASIFTIHTSVAHAQEQGIKQLKNMKQGDKITFAGKSWTLLNPVQGYIHMDESLGDFQFNTWSGPFSNKFNTADSANIGYYLNNIYLKQMKSIEQEAIKERDWHLLDSYGYGSVKAKIGLISWVEWQFDYIHVIGNPSTNTWTRTPPPSYQNALWGMRMDGNPATFEVTEKLAVRAALYLSPDTFVDGDKVILTEVNFEPNGNETWKNTHATKVKVADPDDNVHQLQYQWTKSGGTPAGDKWVGFSSGHTITTPTGVVGEYYLHVRGLDRNNNVVLSKVSKAYNLVKQVKDLKQGDTINNQVWAVQTGGGSTPNAHTDQAVHPALYVNPDTIVSHDDKAIITEIEMIPNGNDTWAQDHEATVTVKDTYAYWQISNLGKNL